MVQKPFTSCQVETRRLLFVIGLLFAVVIVLQYFEFPYGTALSSLFSVAKLPVLGKSNQKNGDSQSDSEIVGNMSLSNDSHHNSTRSTSDFVSQGKGSSNSGLGLDDDDNDAKESSSINQAEQNRTSIVLDHVNNVDNKFAPEKAGERLIVHGHVGNPSAGFVSPSVPAIHTTKSSEYTSPIVEGTNITTPTVSGNSNTSLVEEDRTITLEKNETSERLRTDVKHTENSTTSVITVPEMNLRPKVLQKKPPKVVYSVSDMNNMLLQSRASYYSVVYVKLELYVIQNLINKMLQPSSYIPEDFVNFCRCHSGLLQLTRNSNMLHHSLRMHLS